METSALGGRPHVAAGKTAACVRRLCAGRDVELHVLHVAPPHLAEGVADFIPAQTWEENEASAPDSMLRAQLARIVDAHHPGCDEILTSRRGQLAAEAARYAEEPAVDLIHHLSTDGTCWTGLCAPQRVHPPSQLRSLSRARCPRKSARLAGDGPPRGTSRPPANVLAALVGELTAVTVSA
ncbi:MAG: hypothetical protein KKB50_19020 [Planctomycetes bacterium]|nr:hypothetical protein [Planctomycetota bacterium]